MLTPIFKNSNKNFNLTSVIQLESFGRFPQSQLKIDSEYFELVLFIDVP